MEILYKNITTFNEDILTKCAKLYSEHYGIWSALSKNAGKHVKLSKTRILEWLKADNASICYASCNEDIIGYAIYFSLLEEGYGVVTWITQLVVHENYRHKGIAKNILLSIWGFSDHKAWGIVSANPYAIRALEKITRRRAVPSRIKQDINKIRKIGLQNVCFINADTEFIINENQSKVNTKFDVDHEDILQKLKNVTSDNLDWILGNIEDGWEWVAFTFQDQEQIPLSSEEIDAFIKVSDAIVKEAYSRMILDSNKQKWMTHEEEEIQYLKTRINFKRIKFAYDLGCGVGRHSIVLAKNGIKTIGIDYVESNIAAANKIKLNSSLDGLSFIHADCRNYRSDTKADLILCLYDVVGTFATKDENLKIIKTAYELLSAGGYSVFSVMNYESVMAHKFKFSQNANELLKLKPSNTMEKTGNVFLSDYCLVDEETHVVYRKEQFTGLNKIPRELIVRDMRFTKSEIISMCQSIGFSVIESKYVNASSWEKTYDNKAKEILVICQK